MWSQSGTQWMHYCMATFDYSVRLINWRNIKWLLPPLCIQPKYTDYLMERCNYTLVDNKKNISILWWTDLVILLLTTRNMYWFSDGRVLLYSCVHKYKITDFPMDRCSCAPAYNKKNILILWNIKLDDVTYQQVASVVAGENILCVW